MKNFTQVNFINSIEFSDKHTSCDVFTLQNVFFLKKMIETLIVLHQCRNRMYISNGKKKKNYIN